MDLGSAVGVLLRRYWVLFAGLILTLGATAYLHTQTPPRYQATARVLLLLPADSRAAEGAVSPFLYLPNGLQVLAGIVATGPSSREFQDQMFAAGLTSQYEVGVEVGSPIITVSVEGRDPENVIATRDQVIEEIEEELLTVQREEETPRRQTAHARVYAIEPTPDLLQGDRTRGMLVALGVGGLLTLLAAFGIDRSLQLRAERRRRNAASGAADPGDGWTSQWGWDTSERAADAGSTKVPAESTKEPDVQVGAASAKNVAADADSGDALISILTFDGDTSGGSADAESTKEPDVQVEAANAQSIAADGQTADPSRNGDHREVDPEGERPSSGPGQAGSEGAAPASGVPDGEVTHYQRA